MFRKIDRLRQSVGRRRWLAAAVLSLPVVLYVLPLLLTGSRLAAGDPDAFFQMYEAFRKSVLEYGQLPLWNPWMSGGAPLLADPQFGLISLQSPLVLAFGTVLGWKLAVLGYLLAGFWGARRLLRRGFAVGPFRASALAYVWTFGSAITSRIIGGHYTFLVAEFLPWVAYLYLRRHRGRNWIWLGLLLSLMIWSAAHYMSLMILGVTGVLFAAGIARNLIRFGWKRGLARSLPDLLVGGKVLALVLALSAYRLIVVFDYFREFSPIREPERTIGVGNALRGLFWPDQYFQFPTSLPWGWTEISAYFGLGLLAAVLLVGLAAGQGARRRDFTINPFPVLAAAVGTFVLALGPFASWAPFAIADRLGMLASFRVAPRWLFWTATALLLLVAAYRGRRYRTAITAALGLAATELFLTGMIALPKPYLLSAEQYRPPDAPFEQQWRYRINRNGRPGDENLYETTRNNYGQFIAANSLLFTIEDRFTKRCGLNQNCPFLSPNARLVSWSPNRIEIERTGPGPFLVNMNPGGGWLVNGRYAFSHLRSAEPADYFVVDDPAARIVLEYAPPLSPRWFEYKLKH